MYNRSQQKIFFASTGLVLVGFFIGRLSVRPSTAGRPLQAILEKNHIQADSGKEKLSPAASNLSQGNASSLSSLLQKPATPAGEQAFVAQLQQLAATEPLRALELAAAAPTPRQRELLRNSALQGWAAHDPEAAAVWTLANVRSEERRVAVEALAAGAIARPAEAVGAINHLISADQVQASDYGNALVTAFTRVGEFEAACQFAANGPAEFRAAWLCTTFNQWATYQPQSALAALGNITDPVAQREARAGLYAGWSMSDPASLVTHAETLPIGDARLEALNTGLAQWVHLNPVAASAWMDKFDPAPDLDAGAAAIAVEPALISHKPDVAASWAESITNPELRASTLLDLIRLWGQQDPTAARTYASNSPALSTETRQLALSALEPSP